MKVLLGVSLMILAGAALASEPRALTFEERVAAQRAIEEVYWRHRIWPAENLGPKPPLAAVMPDEAIRAKVEDYLKKSNALETWWQRPITAEQLQAELDRIARSTRDAKLLGELFAALGNDAFLVAEIVARQAFADRLTDRYDEPEVAFDARWASAREAFPITLPALVTIECLDDTWESLSPAPGGGLDATAVWTGAEMIVWGGFDPLSGDLLNTGGRYSPATDTWSVTSTAANVPDPRHGHSAVWTGTEMIIWGGRDQEGMDSSTGGRYDPAMDTWLATSTEENLPDARYGHSTVWTGTEMIIWGGIGPGATGVNTGGRYDPAMDTWFLTSTGENVPDARYGHSSVWTGTEMIVWGGIGPGATSVSTGGRYDPAMDTWFLTSTGENVPDARYGHSAVWTGTEMIVWGGSGNSGTPGAGGRYHPSTDTWTATSTGELAPEGRFGHSLVWTGTEMIVWGGRNEEGLELNTGGRYDPSGDSWSPTSTGENVPEERALHQAVWTGTEMLVRGGASGIAGRPVYGGRYCACPGGSLYHRDADGDGYGDPGLAWPSCDGAIPAGHVTDDADCDDASASVHPGAAEVCDGIDNDCDGAVDEDLGSTTCGVGACAVTVESCAGGQPQICTPGSPLSESNDGLDNDCDGAVDEGSDDAGFCDSTVCGGSDGSRDCFCWSPQPGATAYEVARLFLLDEAFAAGSCATTSDPFWRDEEIPPAGAVYYYVHRPVAPHPGSWDRDSSGRDRRVICETVAGCGELNYDIYRPAFDRARTCDPTSPIAQCVERVWNDVSSGGCGCAAYVNPLNENALSTMSAAQIVWERWLCGEEWGCGAVACPPEPTGGECVPGTEGPGRCVNVY